MDIKKLIEGKEYKLTHAYGQPSQKIKVLKVGEKICPKWGKYWSADIIYTSEDCTNGLITSFNTIECERYLHEL